MRLSLFLRILVSASLLFTSFPDAEGAPGSFRAVPGGRIGRLNPPVGNGPGFVPIPPATTGIAFTNSLSDADAANNRILENGSGIALGDVDGDGLCDLYLCRLGGPNGLYRNLGDWRFSEVPEAGGASCPGQASTGAVLVDVDGDRDLDLLVNGIGAGTRLFLNDASGNFTESTNHRLSKRYGATSLALADLDGDGDLDLYVTNYRTTTFRDNPPGLRIEARRQPDGSVVVSPEDRFIAIGSQGESAEILEKGERDFLYLNRGGGDFAPVSWTQGTFLDEDGKPLSAPPTDWGLSVLFRDLDGDGWPDLYVCNDFVHWQDRIWLNRKGAGFRAAPRTLFRNQSLSSMSVDVADINRDGLDDIFVAEMLGRDLSRRAWQRPNTMWNSLRPPVEDPRFRPEVSRNTLHLARPGGSFAEIAQFSGVAATDWTWSAVFVDVDLDGWEDLLVATGNNHDVQHADVLAENARRGGPSSAARRLQDLSRFPRLETAKLAFRNRHDGTFEETGKSWGFADVGIATALALADLDNDGDLDAVASHLNGPVALYRNESTAPRVRVRLRGERGNSQGVGARITVHGGPVTQSQEIIAGGRYLSGDEASRTFAATAGKPVIVEVRWPGGRITRIPDVEPGSLVEVDESRSIESAPPVAAVPEPRFEAFPVGATPPAQAGTEDDRVRQPLLPKQLSTEGPGVAVIDLDSDGFDDLLVGGMGGANAWRNVGGTGLKAWPERDLRGSSGRPIAGLVITSPPTGTNPPRAFLAESNWRDGQSTAPAGSAIDLQGVHPLPASVGSSGALVAADLIGDGHPDLVVAGRTVAGRWPEAAETRIFRGTANGLEPAGSLPSRDRVTGMVATDLDGDGNPELVVASEWGPLRIFRRPGNPLSAWDPEVTFPDGERPAGALSVLTGRWTGLAAADLDGDGRLDLIAGNWGWNFGEARIDPRRDELVLASGEFGLGTGWHSLLISRDPRTQRWLPWRELAAVRPHLPFIAETAPTHVDYGSTDFEGLLGHRTNGVSRFTARWFATTVFLNRGDHLEARPLPGEAQWSPAFGVSAADFDGDGTIDLYLNQNFFGVDAETSRHDAGLGLLLLGDGRGSFRAQAPAESGIALPGEGRGCAVLDLDRDGRNDLVITQHGGPTQVLHNRTAKPGWAVILTGDTANPLAIGARVQAEFEGRAGPAMEIHAGTGWWSQDSTRIVVTGRVHPTALKVRWPGGLERRYPWPTEAAELRLRNGP